jgi:hypothetical protein
MGTGSLLPAPHPAAVRPIAGPVAIRPTRASRSIDDEERR